MSGWGRGPLVASLAFVAAALAAPVAATPLGLGKTLVGCADHQGFVQDPFSCAIDNGGTIASASAALLPGVIVRANAMSPAGSGNSAQANAGATYFFQVVGGSEGDIVPLLISTTLEASSRMPQNPAGYAQASLVTFTLADGLHTRASVCTYMTACQAPFSSFSGTVSLQGTSGGAGEFVNLTAQAFAAGGNNGLFDEFASAFGDPFIYIDPTFVNASLYSVIVSPGVANLAPGQVPDPGAQVPEPGTLWLVGMGIGLLRQRRRASR